MSVVDMTKATQSPAEVEASGGGRRKLLVAVLVLALMSGAGWWFLLRPGGGAEKAPEPGAVLKLDAIQVNLADDHYLKLGIALQARKDAHEELDGSEALDQAIDLFSGRSTGDLARRGFRDRLKKELEHRLDEAYEGEVIGVYFTEFVTQ